MKMKFVDNETLKTIISIMGFALSIFNLCYLLITNCFKIKFISKSYAFCSNLHKHPIFFEFAIENHSRIPVSLSRMFLIVNGISYEFQWEKEEIGYSNRNQGEKILANNSFYSISLPQIIPGMGIVGGFFLVNTDDELTEENFLKSTVFVVVHTGRGKRKFKLDVPKLSVHM